MIHPRMSYSLFFHAFVIHFNIDETMSLRQPRRSKCIPQNWSNRFSIHRFCTSVHRQAQSAHRTSSLGLEEWSLGGMQALCDLRGSLQRSCKLIPALCRKQCDNSLSTPVRTSTQSILEPRIHSIMLMLKVLCSVGRTCFARSLSPSIWRSWTS